MLEKIQFSISFSPCRGARADPNASLDAVSRTPTVPWNYLNQLAFSLNQALSAFNRETLCHKNYQDWQDCDTHPPLPCAPPASTLSNGNPL